MADVFVSYSHANRDQVGGVSTAVEESGFSLWWDEKLAPGCVYAQVIEQEIEAAGCVLVAWSATARESLWVRAEANEALDQGKLVQLNLDGAKLPLPFNALDVQNCAGWSGQHGDRPWPDVAGRIGAMLRGDAAPVELPAHEPALQGLASVAMLGWAAIALTIVIALAVGAAAMGALGAAPFAIVALIGLAGAVLLLGLIVWRATRIIRASRR